MLYEKECYRVSNKDGTFVYYVMASNPFHALVVASEIVGYENCYDAERIDE